MEHNEILREQILEVVNNQLKNNDPPETKLTYDRLFKEGFSEFQIIQMIGQCVVVELFEVMKSKKPYDQARYVRNLNRLPKEPFD
jgi:hypothetical protein